MFLATSANTKTTANARLPYFFAFIRERDMVAMFHSVVGKMPDGSTEQHVSRLLSFGIACPVNNASKGYGSYGSDSPNVQDSAMAATVGYTTAAAAELVLSSQHSSKYPQRVGVVIPTTTDIYEPLLRRLASVGISWTEDVIVTNSTKKS